MLRNVSIKHKLTLLAMASSTLALLLVSAGFIVYEANRFQKEMTEDLSSTARIVGNHSRAFLLFGGTEKEIRDSWSALAAKPHITTACLYRGTNVASLPYFRDAGSPRLLPVHPGPFVWQFDFSKDQLEGFEPVRLDGRLIGAIYMKSDLNAFYSRIFDYLGITLLLMLATSVIVYLFSLQLQRFIAWPIYHLAQTARMITTQKQYSLRAQKDSNDELGQLIDSFNEMLEQIHRRDAAVQSVNMELEKAREGLELRVHERTRELKQQLAHISLLNQTTFAVAERYDFDSIILVLLQQLEAHLHVDYGCVYRFDAGTNSLHTMVLGPKSRSIAQQMEMPRTLSLDETPFQTSLNGKIVYEPDLRASELPIAQNMVRAGLLSSVTAPLMVENRVFGLLSLSRRKSNAFSTGERDFIRGLTAHAALAVRHAQLYHDLQKAYNELRQTQQTVMQQERLKALGQMASGIAHDINNALSPVVGFSEILLRKEQNLSDKSKLHLRHIRTAGDDIAHIVSRLRDFYRPRDEDEPLLPLNLNKVVDQVIDMTRPRWRTMPQNQGITIEMQMDLAPELPELVGIDSELREVLTNLIINAVDALPKGGTITVRTRFNEHAVAGNHIILEVSDTGVGMDEETKKRCLEPFFSTKGKRGTGLGLSMVYGVVERHEGQIEIDSERGKGTTIRLYFPVKKVEQPEMTEISWESKGRPLHVLCIDDEPLLREVVKEMLERDGHTVETADGGEAGVTQFRTAIGRHQPFDIVLTDLGMPYVDGREVARVIKKGSPETPVVMLTGWGAFISDKESTPSDFDGILSKPPRMREIREMFHRVIYSRQKDKAPAGQDA